MSGMRMDTTVREYHHDMQSIIMTVSVLEQCHVFTVQLYVTSKQVIHTYKCLWTDSPRSERQVPDLAPPCLSLWEAYESSMRPEFRVRFLKNFMENWMLGLFDCVIQF